MVARIVVAYDDSAGARLALALAVELARALTTASLLVVAVDESGNQEPMSYIGDGHGAHPGRPACRAWLEDAARFAGEHGVSPKTEIRVGHPSGQLLAAARAENADLLIIGHSKHPALRNRVIGSTAERVARHSFCPVLIAR
jgi:nucleotide-binding universal stress UspA family protein